MGKAKHSDKVAPTNAQANVRLGVFSFWERRPYYTPSFPATTARTGGESPQGTGDLAGGLGGGPAPNATGARS